jgi:hypothetical protein
VKTCLLAILVQVLGVGGGGDEVWALVLPIKETSKPNIRSSQPLPVTCNHLVLVCVYKRIYIMCRRQISSGVDTTLEDDVFDGHRESSGDIGHPPITGHTTHAQKAFFSHLRVLFCFVSINSLGVVARITTHICNITTGTRGKPTVSDSFFKGPSYQIRFSLLDYGING